MKRAKLDISIENEPILHDHVSTDEISKLHSIRKPHPNNPSKQRQSGVRAGIVGVPRIDRKRKLNKSRSPILGHYFSCRSRRFWLDCFKCNRAVATIQWTTARISANCDRCVELVSRCITPEASMTPAAGLTIWQQRIGLLRHPSQRRSRMLRCSQDGDFGISNNRRVPRRPTPRWVYLRNQQRLCPSEGCLGCL